MAGPACSVRRGMASRAIALSRRWTTRIALGGLARHRGGVRFADLTRLSSWIGPAADWSDLPFIMLTQRGGGPEKNPNAARASEMLGNVTFLERPFHPTTFVSVARSARRAGSGNMRSEPIEEPHESEERLRTALLAGRLGSGCSSRQPDSDRLGDLQGAVRPGTDDASPMRT